MCRSKQRRLWSFVMVTVRTCSPARRSPSDFHSSPGQVGASRGQQSLPPQGRESPTAEDTQVPRCAEPGRATPGRRRHRPTPGKWVETAQLKEPGLGPSCPGPSPVVVSVESPLCSQQRVRCSVLRVLEAPRSAQLWGRPSPHTEQEEYERTAAPSHADVDVDAGLQALDSPRRPFLTASGPGGEGQRVPAQFLRAQGPSWRCRGHGERTVLPTAMCLALGCPRPGPAVASLQPAPNFLRHSWATPAPRSPPSALHHR